MQLRTVSFSDWTSGDPTRRADFVRSLGLGLEELGFVCVSEPGIDEDLLARAYAVAKETFALPVETKLQCELPDVGRQRGYTPYGMERAKDRETPDMKEFWHIGRNLPADDPLVLSGDIPANASPSAVPAFQQTFDDLFANMETFSDQLLEAVGLYLGLDDGTFAKVTENGSTVLRVIHYPPVPADRPVDAVRAAEHEDINLMTVLPVSTASGLEILTRDGDWLPVQTPPGTVIVDTGDMMALLTGNRLKATTHRVVNPEDPVEARSARYSMPFFIHPHPDYVMTPFAGGEPGPTSRDFLMERLRANGVA